MRRTPGAMALQTAVAAAQTVLALHPSRTRWPRRWVRRWPTLKAGKAGRVPPQLRDGHYSGGAAMGNA
jgi:putative ATPase